MRTVSFQSVLHGAARLLGMDPARDLNNAFAAKFAEYINRHVAKSWRFERWPEWTVTEQRWFRPFYVATTEYAATTEVYYPPADKYYQALQDNIGGQAPALLQSDGSYLVNATYWAECQQTYGGADFNPTKPNAVGDVVRNPTDRQFYQKFLANLDVTVAGAGDGLANGDYVFNPAANAYFAPGPGFGIIERVGSQWVIKLALNAFYIGGEDVASPDLVTTWVAVNPGNNPPPTVTLTHPNVDPGDPFYWGKLTPFNKYIAYEQPGFTKIWEAPNPCAFKRDPQVFPCNPWPISCGRSPLGFTFAPNAPNSVWIQFWPPPPVFSSQVYSPTENILGGEVRYYPATGECYLAIKAQNPAGAAPINVTYWSKIDFPFVLQAYVTRAVQSDALRDQKQSDRATSELALAEGDLQDEADKATAGQGIYEQATVVMS